jgi:hypothetical protein
MTHVLFFALMEDITTGAGNLGAAHTSTNGINNAGQLVRKIQFGGLQKDGTIRAALISIE